MKYTIATLLLFITANSWSQGTVPVDQLDSAYAGKVVVRNLDQYAQFPGGDAALRQYLASHTTYPQIAIDLSIQGTCYLQFFVSAKGKISDVIVLRGVTDCPECDAEAVRVISGMPAWVPARDKGKAVDSYVTHAVSFRFSDPEEKK